MTTTMTMTARCVADVAGVLTRPESIALLEQLANTDSASSDTNELELLNSAIRFGEQLRLDLLAADRFLREQYRPRFDGLSSIIGDAVLYQKTVRLLLDEVDITKAGDKLKSIMPQTMAMVITVTAATATGRALTAAERHSVEEACDMIQRISEAQETVVGFISRRTELIAPNLSALVGVDCAALLVSTAGGIQKLGCMSASELAALGKATTVSGDVVATNLATGGAPGNQRHFGHIFKCDIVQNVEEDFRVKCARMVAAKAQIAARVDVFSNTNSGDDSSTEGRRIREELLQNIEKLTAPPPQRDVKPLPIPGQVVKSKRAGRRVQRRKEMRATSELMQAQDRVAFGEAQVQVDTFDDGEGLGLIGTESSTGGKEPRAKKRKLVLTAKQQKEVDRYSHQQATQSQSTVIPPPLPPPPPPPTRTDAGNKSSNEVTSTASTTSGPFNFLNVSS